MFRPRWNAQTLLAPLVGLVLVTVACGGFPEEAQIRQFFRASQLRDTQTLANFAIVSFEPGTDGVVQGFSVVAVSEEERHPIQLKELAKAHEDAKAADDAFSKSKQTYQDANIEAIDRVVKAERANGKVRGKDAEIQAAWSKWRGEAGQSSKKLSDARAKLNAERPLIELSLENPRTPVDPTTVDGDMVSKTATIDAKVRMPDGQVAQKTMLITMQRVVGKSGEKDVTGRWVITALKAGGPNPGTSE